MAIGDRTGLPTAVSIASASPHEVTLVDQALDATLTAGTPDWPIGDMAYDSDGLDERLAFERAIEIIAPNRPNRRQLTQDRRPLRRYRRCWRIERLFAWLRTSAAW